jgi:NAD(P)H-hydrate epimerase
MIFLTAEQIRKLDQFTIENEPISSIDLMERAASKCVAYLLKNEHLIAGKTIKIFVGQGNNGGDGLVIARQLAQKGFSVFVYCLQTGNNPTADFAQNLTRLHQQGKVTITHIDCVESFPIINQNDVVIDALFGLGLTRKLEELPAELIAHINKGSCMTISVDLPSGLFCDKTSKENEPFIIKANITLSFLPVKLAFMFQENKLFCGTIEYLDIGLSQEFINHTAVQNFVLTEKPAWFTSIAKEHILETTPKAFESIADVFSNDFEQNTKQREYSILHNKYVVMKDAHTAITCPNGYCYFIIF